MTWADIGVLSPGSSAWRGDDPPVGCLVVLAGLVGLALIGGSFLVGHWSGPGVAFVVLLLLIGGIAGSREDKRKRELAAADCLRLATERGHIRPSGTTACARCGFAGKDSDDMLTHMLAVGADELVRRRKLPRAKREELLRRGAKELLRRTKYEGNLEELVAGVRSRQGR